MPAGCYAFTMGNDTRLTDIRDCVRESVRFFSSSNKGAIELWTADAFLTNLGIPFQLSELIGVPQGQDPPDVLFRGANFEVKEILDPGRRRHDEYRRAQARAEAAQSADELIVFGDGDPEFIDPAQLGVIVGCEAARLAAEKYVELKLRASLDLLVYYDRQGHFPRNGPMPDPQAPFWSGFRSVSVLIGWAALVFWADSNAPAFLRDRMGTAAVRRDRSLMR